ncbi:MAG TPA: type I restriction endonuclease subunit M, partial [Polyangia bacterium]
IEGHLQGGIPAADVDAESAMAPYWTVCPGLKASLFKKGRKGYFDLRVAKADIKTTIYEHPEFTTFIAQMNAHFAVWKKKSTATLKALKPGFHPKELIAKLSEGLLDHYADRPLVDPYDIYQHLMDYWAGHHAGRCVLHC